jgi:hypothetical protein
MATLTYAMPIIMPISGGGSSNNGNGCMPPIKAAENLKCDLESKNRWSINDYTCGCYIMKGDCEGGLISIGLDKECERIESGVGLGWILIKVLIIIMAWGIIGFILMWILKYWRY